MGKQDRPYNIIKESIIKIQADVELIKSDINKIQNKPIKKNKKIWAIFTIGGTLIIFLSSLIQNLLVSKLDSEISKGTAFVNSMATFDNRLAIFQSQVQANQNSFYTNKSDLSLLNNLCSSYASYCTIYNDMERTVWDWLPIGTKLPPNETVDSELKEKKIAELTEHSKKISELYFKFLVDSLEQYYSVAQLSYYSQNENKASLCSEILINKQIKRTKIKGWYTFFLILGGLLSTIGSFKAIYND